MRSITDVNIEKSIEKQKLVFNETSFDVFDRLIVYFVHGTMVFTALLCFKEFDYQNTNERFLIFTFLPLSNLYGIYTIYRKATEKHFYIIKTPFNKFKNKEILLTFAKKKGYKIIEKSTDCFIFNEYLGELLTPKSINSMVFIVIHHQIYFTILKEHAKLNLPTLTSHLILKYDLKKYLKLQK